MDYPKSKGMPMGETDSLHPEYDRPDALPYERADNGTPSVQSAAGQDEQSQSKEQEGEQNQDPAQEQQQKQQAGQDETQEQQSSPTQATEQEGEKFDEQAQAKALQYRDIPENPGGLLKAFIYKEYMKKRYEK